MFCTDLPRDAGEMTAILGLTARQMQAANFCRAPGCRHCAHTGYHGRRGVFELLLAGQDMRRAISRSAGADTLRHLMEKKRQTSLRDQGRALVCEGVISLAEYQRVLG